MTFDITERKLESLIGESVRKALKEELMQLRAFAVPNISKAEQKDIEKRYGKPSQKAGKSYRIGL